MESPTATNPPNPFVIGVDGGGTKTAAWLAPLVDDGSGSVLGRGTAGPANPRAVGFEKAQGNIEAAIAAAFADARLARTSAAAACFGLAGAGRPDEQERIAGWAKEHGIAAKIKVITDADLVLGTKKSCIALIAGTGSLCVGRNEAGETARCGGWGYLLGDEGSGYAIALAGLREATRAIDQRGPPTALVAAFMEALGAASPHDLAGKIYEPEMTRERLAGLASVVLNLRATDEMARTIVGVAASDLAEMVSVVAKRLRLARGTYWLAMAGGLLTGDAKFQQRVLDDVIGMHGEPSRWQAIPDPVSGAVALAREMLSR